MQKGTLVHAGYLLDDLQQEILRKSIVCQLNNSVIWQIELSTGVAEVEFMPTSETPLTSVPAPRFEPKPELVPEVPAVNASGEDE
jgi:hypothetical protein